MSATQLSLPSTIASSAALASLFSLQPSWQSSDPPSTSAITDPSLVQALLSSSWALSATSPTSSSPVSGLANLAWVLDPFDSTNSEAVLRLTYPDESRDGAQFSFAAFPRNAGVQTALLKYEVRGDLYHVPAPSWCSSDLCAGGLRPVDRLRQGREAAWTVRFVAERERAMYGRKPLERLLERETDVAHRRAGRRCVCGPCSFGSPSDGWY